MLQFRLLPLTLFSEGIEKKKALQSVNNNIFIQKPQLAILLGIKFL